MIQPPKGRGADARDWLANHGLVAQSPPVRASDYALAVACPFAYYLRSRLGLVPTWDGGGAKLNGTIFHMALESLFRGEGILPDTTLFEQETIERCRAGGISEQKIVWIVEDIQFARASVSMWLKAYLDICPVAPGLRCLESEVPIEVKTTPWRHPVRGRFDALLYDDATHEIWIFDAKTSGMYPPSVRALGVEFEFQTLLYLWMGLQSLEKIRDHYKLPLDARLAGFYHYIVDQPGIRILKTDIAKSGMEEARRIYLTRLSDYLKGEGEFAKHREKRQAYPPVVSSKLRMPMNPVEWFENNTEFNTMMEDAVSWAKRAPNPGNFPRNDWFRHLHRWPKDLDNQQPIYQKLSIYHPFFLTPPSEWPSIIEQGGWLRDFRDEKPHELLA